MVSNFPRHAFSLAVSISTLFLGGAFSPIAAQTNDAAPVASPEPLWKRTANGTLNLSQAYFDNWTKGGTNALSWEGRLEGGATRKADDWDWESKGRAVFGQSRLDGSGTRKASDELMLETIYTRKVSEWVHPFASARFQTQFTSGYDYDDSAETRTLVSGSFDPTYLTETVGLGKSWTDAYTVRLGASLKQTFSAARYGYADDASTAEIETFRIEPGVSLTAELRKGLMENILLTSALNLFANFEGTDEIDVRWENQITAKVNTFISLNAALEYLYDKDLSTQGQLRQTLAIGVSFLSI